MAVVFIQASDPAFISEGSGDDRYILSSALMSAGQVVTITDGQGANTLQLEPGLEITSSSTTVNFMVLNLSNGATVRITNADKFTFITGATNTATGTGGAAETFEAFVVNSLGLSGVPTEDTAINGGGATVVEGGGTDVTNPGVPTETFVLATDAAVDEGALATFTLTTTNVSVGTEVPYTITGVSATDVVGGLTGTATVGAGGTANISVEIVADQLTEGPETLTLSLDNGQASASTVVQDTSIATANSYISGRGGNGVVSDYNIELVFEGVFSAEQREVFEKAADYLSALIIGDLPDEGTIDDIRITARLEAIDGPFQTVGFAGPTDLRFGTLLPSQGEMTFDTADADRELAEGTFDDTVAHEMLHALGFGTIWEAGLLGLLSEDTDLRFTGPNAIAAYNAIFTTIATADANSMTGVPVETDFGPGTARGHWDEETFTSEVMTGIGGSADFTSGMTVASLEDLGYDTIFDIGMPAATMPQLDTFMMA